MIQATKEEDELAALSTSTTSATAGQDCVLSIGDQVPQNSDADGAVEYDSDEEMDDNRSNPDDGDSISCEIQEQPFEGKSFLMYP